MTLIDISVLLDLMAGDPVWFEWSEDQLERASFRGPLLINDTRIEVAEIPLDAAFLAGKAIRAASAATSRR